VNGPRAPVAAVVGDPVEHSLSSALFRALASAVRGNSALAAAREGLRRRLE